MAVEQIADRHARQQVVLARRTAYELAQLWRAVDRDRIAASWRALLPQALALLGAAQIAAAAAADRYAGDVLDAYNLTADTAGQVSPGAFGGIASDGRPLSSLLYQPAITTLVQIGRGADPARAMGAGGFSLDLIARTQVADAGRVADGVAIVSRPQLAGYVRVVVGETCARCLILAGKRYRWNAGFERHDRCDCRHVPVAELSDGDVTNPRAYFDALDREGQDKLLGEAGAQAVRDGADMNQVVNARRGAAGLTPAGARITAEEARMLRGGRDVGRLQAQRIFGQDLFVTTEGITTRGFAGRALGANETGVKRDGRRYRFARTPRLMPESIYKIAGSDRDEALRLLRRFGYIR